MLLTQTHSTAQHSTARDVPSAAAGKRAQEAAGSQGHAEAQPGEEAAARAARCNFPAQQPLRYPPGLLSGSTSDYSVTTTLSGVSPFPFKTRQRSVFLTCLSPT